MFEQLKANPKKIMEAAIRDFNHHRHGIKHKPIPIEETLGLDFLSVNNQKFIQDLIFQIDNAPTLFLGIHKSTSQYKAAMRSATRAFNGKSILSLLGEFKHDQNEYKLQLWQQEQNKILGNSTTWDLLEKAISKKDTIKFSIIKEDWLKQKDYTHFCAKALVNMYNIIIPALESYIEYVRNELKSKRKKIPIRILTAYKEYIDKLANETLYQRSQIKESILTRLEIGDAQKDIANGDITMACVKNLKEVGSIKNDPQLPESPRRDINPQIFDKFREIIETTGWRIDKARLYKLSYYKTQNNKDENLTTTIDYEKRKFIIPTTLKDFIPKNKPAIFKLPNFISRLFKGTKMAYEFIQHPHFQYLMAHINFKLQQSNNEPLLEKLNITTNLNTLKNIDFYLQLEGKRIEKTRQKLPNFFQKTPLKILENYKNLLRNFGLNILKQKSELLETITNKLEQEKDKPLSPIEKHSLGHLIDEVEKSKDKYQDTSMQVLQLLMRARLQLLEKTDAGTNCKKNQESPQPTTPIEIQKNALQTAEAMLQNHIPTNEEMRTLLEALNHPPEESPNYSHQNLIMHVNYALQNSIPNILKKEFLTNPFDLNQNDVKVHLQAIRNFSLLMQHQKKNNTANKLAFITATYRYFQQFLISAFKLGSQAEFEKHMALILDVENTLIEIGDDYLKNSIGNLQKSQNQNYDWIIFSQIKLKVEITALTSYLQKYSSGAAEHTDPEKTSSPKLAKNPYILSFLGNTDNCQTGDITLKPVPKPSAATI